MEQREQSQTACRLSYAESRQRKAIAKFSKQFALNKQAQPVDYTEGQEPAVPSGDDNSQTGGGGTTGGELEG